MKTKKPQLLSFRQNCPKCETAHACRLHCGGCSSLPGQEHMHSVCRHCMYAWLEECADAPKKPKKSK